MSNRKGFGTLELIIALFLLGAFYYTMTLPVRESSKRIEIGKEIVEEYADTVIKEVEEEGYISDRLKHEAEEFISDKPFKYISLEGTEEKVESGEDVYLKVEIYNQSSRGGRVESLKTLREGVAK